MKPVGREVPVCVVAQRDETATYAAPKNSRGDHRKGRHIDFIRFGHATREMPMTPPVMRRMTRLGPGRRVNDKKTSARIHLNACSLGVSWRSSSYRLRIAHARNQTETVPCAIFSRYSSLPCSTPVPLASYRANKPGERSDTEIIGKLHRTESAQGLIRKLRAETSESPQRDVGTGCNAEPAVRRSNLKTGGYCDVGHVRRNLCDNVSRAVANTFPTRSGRW